jgi:hypothetical protein
LKPTKMSKLNGNCKSESLQNKKGAPDADAPFFINGGDEWGGGVFCDGDVERHLPRCS